MQCEVWSVECEDFASSLAEKIKRLSREGHSRDRVSLNYRSFMFGKLPPPACPGLCYNVIIFSDTFQFHFTDQLCRGCLVSCYQRGRPTTGNTYT